MTIRFLAITSDEDGFISMKVFDDAATAVAWVSDPAYLQFAQVSSFAGEILAIDGGTEGFTVNDDKDSKVIYQMTEGIETVQYKSDDDATN